MQEKNTRAFRKENKNYYFQVHNMINQITYKKKRKNE